MQRQELRIDQLTVDQMQSRDTAWVGDNDDQRLANSIAATGLLHDVLVRSCDASDTAETESQQYSVVAGSRRYYAALEAGYERLPCKIIEADDVEAAWTSLSENTDRRNLSEQEIAQQLSLIYEMVRPVAEPSNCPDCGQDVDGEVGLRSHQQHTDCELPQDPVAVAINSTPPTTNESVTNRFTTSQQALTYIAARYLGRSDDDAVDLVAGHLRTADLPPVIQSLFKPPDDRTTEEQMAISNYGISSSTRLGSGEGRSGTSRDVASLYEGLEGTLDEQTALTPTGAVLEAVGSLTFDGMSEQEIRQNIREFRREVTAELTADDTASQQEIFTKTLAAQESELREMYEEIEPTRPFRKVDVQGPDTQRHSRWHSQAMRSRDENAHGALVKRLYEERLETLAEKHGWS
jgi:hypothetical protein